MNRRRIIAPAILSLALVLSLVWGYNQNQAKTKYEITLENNYQRLFQDVKKHIENVQVNLSKALVADSKERNIVLFSQIMNEAFFAQDKLAQMPISHAESAKTEKFLTQAADYSAYLIQRHLEGEDITDKQRKALNGLQDNAAEFNGELAKMHGHMIESGFLLGQASGRGGKQIQEANSKIFQTSLVNLDEQMAKSPELIYDGPFSDEILNKRPVGLDDKVVRRQEAEDIAREFFGKDRVDQVDQLEVGKDIEDVKIPGYTFNLHPKNQQRDLAVYMSVSQKGGHVISMVNPRPVSDSKLSVEEAEKKALEYLKAKGFDSMEPNYSLRYDGTVLFNFAPKIDDVTIYPDLIKVKVALDTGEVVGFDAASYYMNHHERNIETPHIDEAEARSKVKVNFNIDSIRLAIIPKGRDEALCYEFKGKFDDSDFIIYINAMNGKEEDILQIIKNDNGTLTF